MPTDRHVPALTLLGVMTSMLLVGCGADPTSSGADPTASPGTPTTSTSARRTGALRRVGEQLGINPETLRNLVSQAEIDEDHRPGVTTAEGQRIAELEREVKELRQDQAALGAGGCRRASRAGIRRVNADNYDVYGVRKMHAELNRRGHRINRCAVHRLMRAKGLTAVSRSKGPRTTVPGSGRDSRPDLLDRDFKASAPNRVWFADITYCRTFAG